MAPPALPGTAVTVLAASAVRQSLIPMAAFYLIFMAALGLGLLQLQRESRPRPGGHVAGRGEKPAGRHEDTGTRRGQERGEEAARPEETKITWERAAAGDERGWWAMIRRVGVTVIAGYVLLMAVDLTYYFAIARVSGNFLDSAVTGPALLLALSMPLYAALTWVLVSRWHRSGPAPDGKGPRNGTEKSESAQKMTQGKKPGTAFPPPSS